MESSGFSGGFNAWGPIPIHELGMPPLEKAVDNKQPGDKYRR